MADAYIWIDFFRSLCWLLFQKVVYNSPETKRRASILSVLTSFITQHLGYCHLYLNPFSFSEPPPMAGNKKFQVGQPPWDGLALPFPYLSTREASLKEMQTKSVTQTQSDLISCWQNFLSSLLAANMFLPSNNVITDAVPSFLAATWWSPTWLRASASETCSSCLCRFMCMWPACIARGTRGAEEACHLWLPILSRC